MASIITITTKERILERFAVLWEHQDLFIGEEALVNILDELQLVLVSRVQAEWFLRVPQQICRAWNSIVSENFHVALLPSSQR